VKCRPSSGVLHTDAHARGGPALRLPRLTEVPKWEFCPQFETLQI
jgi:hypothetical protein